MIYVIVIVIVVLSIAFYGNSTTVNLQRDQGRVHTVAEQMIHYHVAAAQVCSNACADTEINPRTMLSSTRRDMPVYQVVADKTAQTFVSGAVGQYVYTFHTGAGIPGERRDEFAVRLAEDIVASMERDTGVFVGIYDAARNELVKKSDPVWLDPSNQQPSLADPGVISLAGAPVAVPGGAIVIVNRK